MGTHGRVIKTFGGPVLDRFVVQRKIDARADEIEAFRRYWRKTSEKALHEMEGQLAMVKAELRSPDLPDENYANMEHILTDAKHLDERPCFLAMGAEPLSNGS